MSWHLGNNLSRHLASFLRIIPDSCEQSFSTYPFSTQVSKNYTRGYFHFQSESCPKLDFLSLRSFLFGSICVDECTGWHYMISAFLWALLLCNKAGRNCPVSFLALQNYSVPEGHTGAQGAASSRYTWKPRENPRAHTDYRHKQS